MRAVAVCCTLLVFLGAALAAAPPQGLASGTKYNSRGSYYQGGTGACDCRDNVPNYPTAALSENAFGVGTGKGAGPACGKCYKLRVYGSPHSNVCLNNGPTMVVKIADLCPEMGSYGDNNAEWCLRSWTNNRHGFPIHFDIDQAHTAIFEQAVGAGTFKLQYCEVPCTGNWAGAADSTTAGQKFGWGYCPMERNTVVGDCNFEDMCAGSNNPPPPPPPAPAGGGGGGSATCSGARVNAGSNTWWIGIEGITAASSVTLDCGDARGAMAMSKSDWGAWIWTPQQFGNTPCANSFRLNLNGQQCSFNL